MPRNTTSSVFFYTYVLESLKDFDRYIGYTDNLKRRIEEHKKGLSFATKFRLPFKPSKTTSTRFSGRKPEIAKRVEVALLGKLIYFEGCLNQEDAKRREDYLKTTQGRRFLGLRLLEYKRHQSAFGSGS